MKENRQFVTALARGLDILRCFTAQRPRLGTTELAQLTGLPQPTVWRLCHTLVTLGYLVPTDRDKLRIGAPVLALGYSALAALDYAQVVRPHMQQLADRFHAAVALAERHRLSMLYLERCQGDSLLLMNLHIGSRIPIRNSAVGWAYVAGLTGDEREALFKEMADAGQDRWAHDKANIDEALKFYDDHGFVVNRGLQHPDVNAAAVPVRSMDGSTLLSLNCGGPSSVLSQEIMMRDVGPALISMARVLHVELVPRR